MKLIVVFSKIGKLLVELRLQISNLFVDPYARFIVSMRIKILT